MLSNPPSAMTTATTRKPHWTPIPGTASIHATINGAGRRLWTHQIAAPEGRRRRVTEGGQSRNSILARVTTRTGTTLDDTTGAERTVGRRAPYPSMRHSPAGILRIAGRIPEWRSRSQKHTTLGWVGSPHQAFVCLGVAANDGTHQVCCVLANPELFVAV